ncbi:MAG: sugar ABC transporter permease [Anaerolineae bacterium]|jgi:sn-glycerol 3-phosphate transport system permease protein|nr:sugar ABC transporter permease [Anaerolineae bacterium]
MDVARKWLGRGWMPLMVVAIFAFIIWFFAGQTGGLTTLWNFLVGAVAVIPEAVNFVSAYYQQLPTNQLIQSLLIGGGVGAVLTIIVSLNANRLVKFPRVELRDVIIGLVVGVVYHQIGAYLFDAVLVGIITIFGVALIFQEDENRLMQPATWRNLIKPASLRAISISAGIGAVFGAVGGQLLNYPSQHCTLTTEADIYTQQMGMILTAIGAIVVLLPVWTIILQRNRRVEQGGGYYKGWVMPAILLAPTLISLVIFLYYPSVQIALQSMMRQRGRRASSFVCLENYADLVADTVYRSSFITTFFITAGIVLFSMALGLMIALLASQKIRGASVYRTLLIWPYAVSPVVTAVIFIAIFRNDPNGFANFYLGGLLGGAQNWIGNANLAPFVIILASVWNALGFNILFYVAGLQNVPKDLLEAAQIDGANVVQRFIRITFPMLSPFTFFLLITNVTFGVYGLYGVVETLTQGGPTIGEGAGATNVLIYKLYSDLLSTSAQIGNVAAQSVILFVLVAVITIAQFQFVERRVTYSGD